MAKKAKTIELKSVPTEPQRGAGQDASYDDPVTIFYPQGGISRLIGSLAGGDEDEAVIKTGGCIVEHDINVRYSAVSSNVSIDVFSIDIGSGGALSSLEKIGTISGEIGKKAAFTLPDNHQWTGTYMAYSNNGRPWGVEVNGEVLMTSAFLNIAGSTLSALLFDFSEWPGVYFSDDQGNTSPGYINSITVGYADSEN